MSDFLQSLLDDKFMPHGHCYWWRPDILWPHVIGDALTVLAYYAIPFVLFYFVKKRKDLKYKWVFVLFAVFILACGTTHIISIITVWHPYYKIEVWAKMITGIISIITAIAILPVIPKALKIPSTQILDEANRKLQTEVEHHKQTTEELNNKSEKLQESVKNLQSIAYATSHDIKEPVRGIVIQAQIFKRTHKDLLTDEAHQELDQIINEGKRMTSLVESLLEYSSSEVGTINKAPTNLNHLLIDSLKVYKYPIDKHEILVTTDPLPVVNADAVEILKLFDALIDNAIRYRKPIVRSEINIKYTELDDYHQISINDNGIGFDNKYKEQVFEMFTKVHARDQKTGAGLGLFVCKVIVTAHDGTIWVESEEGVGSTFHFTLPKG